MLRAEFGVGIPAGIEEDEEGADMMFRRDGEEDADTVTEAVGVLLPDQVVKEDAHGVHAEGFGPAQLEVDAFGVEGFGLPHLELIDGVGGDVVAADEPGLMGVPFIRLRFRPSRGGGRLGCGGKTQQRQKRGGREVGGADFQWLTPVKDMFLMLQKLQESMRDYPSLLQIEYRLFERPI